MLPFLFFIMLMSTIFNIASASIGIQYYNKCEKIREQPMMKRNLGFLIAALVLSLILGPLGIYKTITIGPAKKNFQTLAGQAMSMPMGR